MKQTAMDSDVLFLPHEIIRNILKRLPVKSLIRFQCVCKDWKNLIQNPSFIAEHLQQPTHQNPSLLLECYGINIPLVGRLILLDCGLQVRGVQNTPSNDSLCNARIVGSCNGLLCLEIYQFKQFPSSLSLWNPATTAVRHVPRIRTDISYFDYCVTGFGFSPIVNDYKIVRTFSVFYDGVTQVEVFSLNRGTWKAIDIGNLKGVRLKSETVTANGAIFWSELNLGQKKEGEDNIDFHEDEDYIEEAADKVDAIVSFDIAKEVFTMIPRPKLDYYVDVNLTVYENKLALLCVYEDDEIPYVVDLWVLNEGTCASGQTWSWTKRYTASGQTWSWTERYTTSPFVFPLIPVTIWRNEIVYRPISEEHDDKGRRRRVLSITNLTTNDVKRSVIPYSESIRSIYNYVESLVSVGNQLH
ncbi:hypothetical protein QN277_009169 [Acacia crassicarpa]|uniref:F-box domain-containing protein n=1 Tax=Acacia crassicarpa TaxID=499986 RepID=A0AAE1M8Z2_9FABA|nr:hypothetical protein QN277_009169 [Acacia crassicarpa]